MADSSSRISELLQSSDPRSAEELLPLVYDELRRLAQRRLAREKPGQTLQPTALVHEAFLRITGADGEASTNWNGHQHFFAVAAEAMRRILLNQARRKKRIRHGGERDRIPLDDAELGIDSPVDEVLAVDEALRELERVDPRAREIINLRYFVGLTIPETAAALGVSESTIEREWRFLRTFLQEALDPGDATGA